MSHSGHETSGHETSGHESSGHAHSGHLDTGRGNVVLDAHVAATRAQVAARTPWQGERLPTLFISHGAPPLLDHAQWMRDLAAWADRLPTPRAIVIVSAHWEAAPVAVSAPGVPLVYDFGGFERRFWSIDYQPPVDADWVRRVSDATGAVPSGRGLDHGAWVPLIAMYPDAQVPVVQVSLPLSASADELLRLGARLSALRDEGALLVGSGFATHGLPFLSRANWEGDPTPPPWSIDFDAWLADRIEASDVNALLDPARAPGMPYAHPTAEHYTPLLVAIGAAGQGAASQGAAGLGAAASIGAAGQGVAGLGAAASTPIDGYFMGLSKRSLEFA